MPQTARVPTCVSKWAASACAADSTLCIICDTYNKAQPVLPTALVVPKSMRCAPWASPSPAHVSHHSGSAAV